MNKIENKKVKFNDNKNIEIIDGKKSGAVLTVRFWQQGDVFQPLGMKNRRKLSDFFTDIKMSTLLRRETPIVCSKGKIVWIAGYRLDDNYKVSADTKLFYKLELKTL